MTLTSRERRARFEERSKRQRGLERAYYRGFGRGGAGVQRYNCEGCGAEAFTRSTRPNLRWAPGHDACRMRAKRAETLPRVCEAPAVNGWKRHAFSEEQRLCGRRLPANAGPRRLYCDHNCRNRAWYWRLPVFVERERRVAHDRAERAGRRPRRQPGYGRRVIRV